MQLNIFLGNKACPLFSGVSKEASTIASLKSDTGETEFKPSEACVVKTVSAVKALLAATREERRKRGKYHKYSPELQEQMAAYAVKHGNLKAVRYFSERLGTVVSESTIRNIVKVHSSFTPVLKDEIGRFAANFGVESAARYFSERLKRDISQSLVRKFKVIHLTKLPDPNKRQVVKRLPDTNKCQVSKYTNNRDSMKKYGSKKKGASQAKRYSYEIEEEIGCYACEHSVSDTAKYFSEKLQTVVRERTVRRFHKAFLNRCHLPSNSNDQQAAVSSHHLTNELGINLNLQQQPSSQPHSIPVSLYGATPFTQQLSTTVTAACNSPIHTSRGPAPALPLYPLNQCSSDHHCYQPQTSSVIMTQSSTPFHYQSIDHVQNFQTAQPYSSQQSVSTIHHDSQQGQPSFVVTTQPVVVSNENNLSAHFMITPPSGNLPVESQHRTQHTLSEKDVQKNSAGDSNVEVFIAVKYDHENNQGNFGADSLSLSTNANSNAVVEVSESSSSSFQNQKMESLVPSGENESNVEDIKNEVVDKNIYNECKEKGKLKKKETSKKRGKYTFYSPELRAEIGKYAAEHSSIKASQHFSKLLGHNVAESTTRGLKEKYLQKKNRVQVQNNCKAQCNVTFLAYSQRGRPLLLGKYDVVVQECLKELVRHGEKVTSHLAITTAKLILNKYEPQLLKDNGGPIKLNITWAKSFLKRIGVHNNS